MDSRSSPRRWRDRWLRLRSWVRYGTTLRVKLIVLVLLIACLAVGALYWFSFLSLQTSIVSIYEQRARSVAAVISKSIQEKEYILYYSDELDADIGRLLDRYESVVTISVIGISARGFLVVACTDPTAVGVLVSESDRERFEILRQIEVADVRIGNTPYLRAYHPIFSGADLIGVVVVDMSLAEQAWYVGRLSWQFGAASIVGFLLLGGLLYLALLLIVSKPVGQLAEAVGFVAQRKYDVEVTPPFQRIPGTRQRDEVSQLIDGFNLMTKVIHSHEQELLKLVVLDELTGAYRLDHLRTELEREIQKTKRYKHPTSLLLIEVRGTEARSSDEQKDVLIRTAGFLMANVRKVDTVFRVRERRFAVLLPETPTSGAAVVAERLRARSPDVSAQVAFPVTLTISSAGWSEDNAPALSEILDRIGGAIEDLGG
jgi:diguanylate cyclase (GGDEF)-like protein